MIHTAFWNAAVCLLEISLDASDKELDDAAVLAVLHNLYSMTFTPQGKEAMVYVFTLNENISVLLPFIEMTGAPFRNIDSVDVCGCVFHWGVFHPRGNYNGCSKSFLIYILILSDRCWTLDLQNW